MITSCFNMLRQAQHDKQKYVDMNTKERCHSELVEECCTLVEAFSNVVLLRHASTLFVMLRQAQHDNKEASA